MVGVVDRHNPSRVIPAQIQCLDVLDTSKLPVGAFHLILMGSGSIVATIDKEPCVFNAPSVLCLNEKRELHIQSGHVTDVQVISFSPTFLNVNMTPEFLQKPDYTEMCASHSFFQLSPFLTNDMGKISFHLSEDTFALFRAAFHEMARNFTEQPDWYWSCRARSYFIDILNVVERLFHDYDLPTFSEDALYSADIQQSFREVIVYINNHLHEKITLSHLYDIFRLNKNKLEALFRECLGKTMKEYINQRRFEEASYYLCFTDLVGEEIAHRLSFTTAQYFSRFFLRMSGQTPEEFRKEKVNRRKADMEKLHRIEQESRTVREKEMW